MSISNRHILKQGRVIRTLAGVGLSSLVRRPDPQAPRPEAPGPWVHAELRPRSRSLIRDYIKNSGGDSTVYEGYVPAHLFPQWGFPLAARAISTLPYPLAKVMNAGCRIEQNARLPAGEKLLVRARLEALDDDGRRALITQRIITGTQSVPDAIVADIRAYVPLAKPKRSEGRDKVKAKPTVPSEARELRFMQIGSKAGLDFAKLTGDFNPIHWVPPYAKMAGFKACILHGFATLARAVEALNAEVLGGDVERLSVIDVRFTRPLTLPARVGVYVTDEGGIWVGDAPGGDAYLEGSFQLES